MIDGVIESSAERVVAYKQVTNAEEYLLDHFPGFPVLPGVFMIETLVQASRVLAREAGVGGLGGVGVRLVLGSVRGVKYGSFVRPGQSLVVEAKLHKLLGDGSVEIKGEGRVRDSGEIGEGDAGSAVALSGRITLRPVRVGG